MFYREAPLANSRDDNRYHLSVYLSTNKKGRVRKEGEGGSSKRGTQECHWTLVRRSYSIGSVRSKRRKPRGRKKKRYERGGRKKGRAASEEKDYRRYATNTRQLS